VSIGLKHLLEGTSFAVEGTASDEAFFSISSPDASPKLFVLDGSDTPAHLVASATNLKARYPEAQIAIIGRDFDLSFVRLARDAGVHGFCLSACGREVLVKSLELIMLGQIVLPPSLMLSLLDATPLRPMLEARGSHTGAELESWDARTRKLSSRESQILNCLTEGAPNKVIARKLDVAEATVKVHVKAILRKIGAANRTQAAMWATAHLPTNVEHSVRS